MPKHIQGIRESILSNTRDILINQGYDALAIRDIAARCNASVGTIYHYFASKEVLVASVMLDDWNMELASVQAEIANAKSIYEVLDCIYYHTISYSNIYQKTWDYCGQKENVIPLIRDRHDTLVQQISDLIRPQLVRFDTFREDALPVFLANIILMQVNLKGLKFKECELIFHRLLDN